MSEEVLREAIRTAMERKKQKQTQNVPKISQIEVQKQERYTQAQTDTNKHKQALTSTNKHKMTQKRNRTPRIAKKVANILGTEPSDITIWGAVSILIKLKREQEEND